MLNLVPITSAIEDFFKTPTLTSTRLFHGRGGCYPGLQWCAIDAFAPTVLITLYAPPPDGVLIEIQECITRFLTGEWFSRLAVQHRYLANSPYTWAVGEPLMQAFAQRGEHRFHLHYDRQNVGFFLDMEPGRQWLEARAVGARVLNLFSFTCAFSVVAQAAGARSVVNVDMSKAALKIGRDNHALNNLTTQNIQFMPLDILKSWSRIAKPGPYNVVIIDPPTFQKGSFIAAKDYAKVVRRLPDLVAPGGEVLACLNAPELDDAFLLNIFAQQAPGFQFIQRLPLPKVFCDNNPQGQLKLLHYINPTC